MTPFLLEWDDSIRQSNPARRAPQIPAYLTGWALSLSNGGEEDILAADCSAISCTESSTMCFLLRPYVNKLPWWRVADPCTVSIQTAFPDWSRTVHSTRTTSSRLEKAKAFWVVPTSANLGSSTTCASPALEESSTRVRLVKMPLSAGSNSVQAALPTGNFSDFFLFTVAQNSGVRTSAAVSDSFCGIGCVWFWAIAKKLDTSSG